MKNDSLEGLRGLAALGVLLAHILLALFPYLAHYSPRAGDIPQAHWWETYLSLPIFTVFFNGNFAVSIFFVLSGYVLTKKFFETDDIRVLRKGAIKRYPRLVIPAAFSVIFAWSLMSLGWIRTDLVPKLQGAGWPTSQYRTVYTFQEALWNGFVGAPILNDIALNVPLWTIQIELFGSLFLFAA